MTNIDAEYLEAWRQLEPVCKEISQLIVQCPISDRAKMLLALMACGSAIGTAAACIQKVDDTIPVPQVMQSIFDFVTPSLMAKCGEKMQ